MRIHREGRPTLTIIAIVALVVCYLVIRLTHNPFIVYPILALFMGLYIFVMYFFRFVERPEISDKSGIIAPCDGKVVVIEDQFEDEYMKENMKKISIFMSPLNVHINWFPISGKVLFSKIHQGSHLVAWAPKSSTDNERSTVVMELDNKQKIVVRQVAGAVARRVVCYAEEGKYYQQNEHLGFIKFGSRVDIYLPKDAEIKVNLEDKVVGSQTVIARLAK